MYCLQHKHKQGETARLIYSLSQYDYNVTCINASLTLSWVISILSAQSAHYVTLNYSSQHFLWEEEVECSLSDK